MVEFMFPNLSVKRRESVQVEEEDEMRRTDRTARRDATRHQEKPRKRKEERRRLRRQRSTSESSLSSESSEEDSSYSSRSSSDETNRRLRRRRRDASRDWKCRRVVQAWRTLFSREDKEGPKEFLTMLSACRKKSNMSNKDLLRALPSILDKSALRWYLMT